MALQLNSAEKCPKCGFAIVAQLRHCPTCKADLGAPNVRLCRRKENLVVLKKRAYDAQRRSQKKGCSNECRKLETLINQKSGVVVSMAAGIARKLFDDPKAIYNNYESLVGGGVRKPASFDDDRHRCAVAGFLFGSYAAEIVYGVLSLTNDGLPTYGYIHCRLRSVAIEDRTSFLEKNSYEFVKQHKIRFGDRFPMGYMACWKDRQHLVIAKLADQLANGLDERGFQALLLHSDGVDRQNDDFVEAHIYEKFDQNAIETIDWTLSKSMRREDIFDVKTAVSKFNKLRKLT